MIGSPGTPHPARSEEPEAERLRPSSGYLARPASAGPGVVILHAWWGLNAAFRQMCDRLAGDGFTVLAPDLYGDGCAAATIAEANARADALDAVGARQVAVGALDTLLAEPGRAGDRLGVVGFSLGASFALWAARTRPEAVGAVVLYYGTGTAGDERTPVLGHFAPGDPWQPDADVDRSRRALKASGREVTFHRYPGTRHWFCEPDRPEWEPVAAELAWRRSVAFLRQHLASDGAPA